MRQKNNSEWLIKKRPKWLSTVGPSSDICLSSRVRILRNLAGYRFPHHASPKEVKVVCDLCCHSIAQNSNFTILRGIGASERNAFVASRLISHDFPSESLSRAICLDDDLMTSIMVNEEDHLRVQTIQSGWCIESTAEVAFSELNRLTGLEFAWSPKFGYLSASPFNCGDGVRISAMFHLVALAASKQLPRVLRALDAMQVVGRGLYGESSRAIGAFVQISVPRNDLSAIRAAGQVVMAEEARQREILGKEFLYSKAIEAIEYGIASRSISLADSFRVLGWARWSASASIFPGVAPTIVDAMLAKFEPTFSGDSVEIAKSRAVMLREFLEPLLSST